MSGKKTKKTGMRMYTFTHSELNKFVQDVSRKNLSIYLAACVEEFNWSTDEIEQLFNRVERYMKAVDDNLITLADVERMIGDELGAQIFANIYVKPPRF